MVSDSFLILGFASGNTRTTGGEQQRTLRSRGRTETGTHTSKYTHTHTHTHEPPKKKHENGLASELYLGGCRLQVW